MRRQAALTRVVAYPLLPRTSNGSSSTLQVLVVLRASCETDDGDIELYVELDLLTLQVHPSRYDLTFEQFTSLHFYGDASEKHVNRDW